MIEDREDLNFQTMILILLSQTQYLTRRTILLLKEKPNKGYYAINHLLDLGYIKEKRIKIKFKKKYLMETCYQITTEGVNFLNLKSQSILKNNEDDPYYQWIRYLPKVQELRNGGRGGNHELIARHLPLSTLTTIAFLLEMSYAPVYVKETDEQNLEPNTLQAVVSGAMKKDPENVDDENGYVFLNPESEIRFTNSKVVKQELDRNHQDINALQFGRYVGIIESPNKSLLVYGPSKTGIGWSKNTTDSEIKAFKFYLKKHGLYTESLPVHVDASLFVDNAKMFENILKDKAEKRKNNILGEGIREFTVFPLSNEGVKNFESYINISGDMYNKAFVEQAVKSGIYKENKNTLIKDIFPLIDSDDGSYVYNGSFIDIRMLEKLRNYLSTHDVKFKILCYDFQIEYYSRIVTPNAYKRLR